MGEKQDLIAKMLEMQKKFMDFEHANGVDMEDYYVGDDSHPLHDYRKQYMDMANKLVDMAHEEKGSQR